MSFEQGGLSATAQVGYSHKDGFNYDKASQRARFIMLNVLPGGTGGAATVPLAVVTHAQRRALSAQHRVAVPFAIHERDQSWFA